VAGVGVGDDLGLLVDDAGEAGHDELAAGALVDGVVHDLEDARGGDALAFECAPDIARRLGRSGDHGRWHTVAGDIADDEQHAVARQVVDRPPVASALRRRLKVADHLDRPARMTSEDGTSVS
jgi:hypothetical protein